MHKAKGIASNKTLCKTLSTSTSKSNGGREEAKLALSQIRVQAHLSTVYDNCGRNLIFIELISNTPQSASQGVGRRTWGRAHCLCVDWNKWLASLMSSHQPLVPPAVTSHLMVIIWKASTWQMSLFRFGGWFPKPTANYHHGHKILHHRMFSI